MQLRTLPLDEHEVDTLACALLHAIDDLEARAILSEHGDPVLGPVSANEYRRDLRCLRTVLDAIAPGDRPADPTQVAVRWIDGTWSIVKDHPVPLLRQDQVRAPLESACDLVEQQLLDPHHALTAIHHLVTCHTLDRLDTARLHLLPDPDHDDEALTVQTSPDARTSFLPTPQAAHRLAPGCEPAPARVAETGAGQC